ncbi:ClpA/ClpB-like protein [Nocardia pseudobrasiliensis]|uniref:ClpA/ClpB-like protein n=1 Tax=Nocardia pseudobrasiliensis TaxID=45979 RepID=A0A370HML3_9NOCA|nr:ClpA/ClpB-like protein [Nocardia pseudobrasiliensis]
MFERFTDRARRVVVLAQEQARQMNHNYIGTEHILLGLIAEGEGIAAQVLHDLEIELTAMRADVEQIIGRGKQEPAGYIPFTPRAKKVLEMSHMEAVQLGHSYIGTEHVLLGLVIEHEGVGAQVLERRGAALEDLRARILARLGQRPTVSDEAAGPAQAVIHSLEEENRLLRKEIDRLRRILAYPPLDGQLSDRRLPGESGHE